MVSKEKLEMYQELAKRNGWNVSIDNNDKNERPYFLENGKYATPNEKTSEEDKRLLAEIISEGSEELANLLITCWDNGLKPSGPCSGIKEFHSKPPFYLHFGVIGSNEIIYPLSEELSKVFPNFNILYRDGSEEYRLDLDYILNGKELSKEESNAIFKVINEKLNEIIKENKITEGTNLHM